MELSSLALDYDKTFHATTASHLLTATSYTRVLVYK